MGNFQYQWWTIDVREATGRIGWEIKAKNKENAIKEINKRVSKYNEFIHKRRPDFNAEIYWDTLTLDRQGFQRRF